MLFQRVHVVINPAAGQDEPVLSTLNSVFREAGVDWDVSITKNAGDAAAQAKHAADGGAQVVAAYGGDGTVAEVATGLIGTDIPMAILPGGTANAMSSELRIPQQLRQAAELICSEQVLLRKIDMGEANGRNFILRVGVGFEAAMVESADRDLKDRFGNLAYFWAALQNLAQPKIATYRLVIDGQQIETEGLTCMIANSGNLAQRNLNLLPGIDISDGLLDIIVIQPAGLRMFVDLIGGMTGLMNMEVNGGNTDAQGRRTVQWWQARQVELVSNPEQSVQLDGEVLGTPDVRCRVLPQALRVLTPGATNSKGGAGRAATNRPATANGAAANSLTTTQI